ncbi:hypothetical protein DPEC_G00100640 [Dallia pectoralis]|uniref:Uncharacterized protein n=1 Tax=Dallia pectoralis TaxID=75939 RepID=A0ACC2GWZ0_DALPE|nr:hypothetical protein DPEC_G00100640 [Dallia pectoralis]
MGQHPTNLGTTQPNTELSADEAGDLSPPAEQKERGSEVSRGGEWGRGQTPGVTVLDQCRERSRKTVMLKPPPDDISNEPRRKPSVVDGQASSVRSGCHTPTSLTSCVTLPFALTSRARANQTASQVNSFGLRAVVDAVVGGGRLRRPVVAVCEGPSK